MAAIGTVLFDLDDTLCDYATAQRTATARVNLILREHGIADTEAFWTRFRDTDPLLFADFTAGRMSIVEYRRQRFTLPAENKVSSIRAFADRANEAYMAATNDDIRLFDDALPTIAALTSAGVRVAVLTNGPSDGQRRKIAGLGLDQHVEHIFISAELGVAKPDVRAFAMALDRLRADPGESLMVGDSLEVDVQGAITAGLQAILIDRRGATRSALSITSLADLLRHVDMQ